MSFSNTRSHAGTVAATGSGKYYGEIYYKTSGGNRLGVGIVNPAIRGIDNTGYSVGSSGNTIGGTVAVFAYYGQVFNNLISSPTNINYLAPNAPSYAAIAAGDIVQIAMDLDAGTVKFGVNDVWYNDQSTSTFALAQTISIDATKDWTWFSGGQDPSQTQRVVLNAGQDPFFAGNKTSGQDTSQSEFYYEPPSGFVALSTGNLATPTIAKPAEHFDTKIWTGNGSSSDRDITGLSFEPDLIWYKSRTDATHHCVQDDVRGWGATKIGTNSTATEDSSNFETQYGYIKASVSGSGTANGFTVAQGASGTQDMVHTNMSAKNYVAWNWKGGTSFDAGGGSGTGSKNVDAGFSIAKWTGDDDGMGGP